TCFKSGIERKPKPKRKLTVRERQIQQRDDEIANTLAQQALHLDHTMQEELAMMQAGLDRRVVQAKSTRNIYARYQSHWTKWCKRRGYLDNDVLVKRFVRYMAEDTAEFPDPEKGIEPIRARPRGRAKGMKRNKAKKLKKSIPNTMSMK
ncbi:hypothetical protein FBU30_003276, partial [Linnemannia zychae]